MFSTNNVSYKTRSWVHCCCSVADCFLGSFHQFFKQVHQATCLSVRVLDNPMFLQFWELQMIINKMEVITEIVQNIRASPTIYIRRIKFRFPTIKRPFSRMLISQRDICNNMMKWSFLTLKWVSFLINLHSLINLTFATYFDLI
ncbi:hypothetical protein M8C21_002382, partial [Ambrosia artemisiifolia]